MAENAGEFQSWLSQTLKDLNTDEEIFGSYITGILESDESAEEKSEALQGLLAEIVQNAVDINKITDEILIKWTAHHKKQETPLAANSEDVDVRLVKLLESQCVTTTKQKEHSEEDKKMRETILSLYGRMYKEDEIDGEGDQETEDSQENLEKNLNAQTVVNAERLKREQAKLDSQKKKEKDREDREKQKQLKEEKKEKRKTQKGERPR